MLLQDLHDSHVCNSLLVAESEEDIWKNESLYRQKLNTSDGRSGEGEGRRCSQYSHIVIIKSKICAHCCSEHRLQHGWELPGQGLSCSHHAVHPGTFRLRCCVEHDHPHSPTSQDGTQHGGVQGWVAHSLNVVVSQDQSSFVDAVIDVWEYLIDSDNYFVPHHAGSNSLLLTASDLGMCYFYKK